MPLILIYGVNFITSSSFLQGFKSGSKIERSQVLEKLKQSEANALYKIALLEKRLEEHEKKIEEMMNKSNNQSSSTKQVLEAMLATEQEAKVLSQKLQETQEKLDVIQEAKTAAHLDESTLDRRMKERRYTSKITRKESVHDMAAATEKCCNNVAVSKATSINMKKFFMGVIVMMTLSTMCGSLLMQHEFEEKEFLSVLVTEGRCVFTNLRCNQGGCEVPQDLCTNGGVGILVPAQQFLKERDEGELNSSKRHESANFGLRLDDDLRKNLDQQQTQMVAELKCISSRMQDADILIKALEQCKFDSFEAILELPDFESRGSVEM